MLIACTNALAGEVGLPAKEKYSTEDAEAAMRFDVVLGRPYVEVRRTLEAAGWFVEPSAGVAGSGTPAMAEHPEVTCGEGRDAVCTVRVTRDGEDWLLEIDATDRRLSAIGFWSDTVEPPPQTDTRCFTQSDKRTAPLLRFRTYREASTDWIGGYARYGTSRAVLPLVLEDEVAIERNDNGPSRVRMTWREYIDGKPSGRYETTSQYAVVEGLRYFDATGKRAIDFEPVACP